MVCATLDDELVMMSSEKGEYFGLGGIGPRILELLSDHGTIEEIAEILCQEYDVDRTRCAEDVRNFVLDLIEIGLVVQS